MSKSKRKYVPTGTNEASNTSNSNIAQAPKEVVSETEQAEHVPTKEEIMQSLVESAAQIPSDGAFPMSVKLEYSEDKQAAIAYRKGLTKREYYASLAMSSMAARLTKLNAPDVDFIAHESVRMADALIEALTDKEA